MRNGRVHDKNKTVDLVSTGTTDLIVPTGSDREIFECVTVSMCAPILTWGSWKQFVASGDPVILVSYSFRSTTTMVVSESRVRHYFLAVVGLASGQSRLESLEGVGSANLPSHKRREFYEPHSSTATILSESCLQNSSCMVYYGS